MKGILNIKGGEKTTDSKKRTAPVLGKWEG